ncbi:lauroyl acyltransferase [Agrilutibacter solisilvae]|uniref:Lauroyl acyltransferase n=1 Tax=Agrilutibacter solisilvae TaxID=2763317 RepID=A0A975ASC8_9GAMM|nr:lauroyl acyltransferase [Lysobacter solisilvae]QSX78799.1 lauroyl acyltransferase [Lysobacter solisilvae]
MTDLAARLLHLFATALARLPWRWLMRLGDGLAAWMLRRNTRESRVVRRNLELTQPQLPAAARDDLHQRIVRTTARQALETLRMWTRPHAENLGLIRQSHGVDLFDAAIAAGRGVIVAAPHYGNWELLNQWLAAHTPLAILYAPPESAVGDAFLRLVRADDAQAARVTQVRAEGPGVRQLFKLLKDGGVVGILPDQQPKQGDGEFAPFFGVPALTMTLLGRLAHRTGAAVVFAWCERIDAHDDGPGFALHIEAAPPAVADADPVVAVAALNQTVERIARRDPSQYQWTYKRYTLQPSGNWDDNPYKGIR